MKRVFQYFFDHKKAFIYLYLLVIVLEDQEMHKRWGKPILIILK